MVYVFGIANNIVKHQVDVTIEVKASVEKIPWNLFESSIS